MITVLMDEVELIIDSMDPAERKVMTVVGRIGGSANRNFTRQTIRKKLRDDTLPEADRAIDSLRRKGLIRYYRKPDNFATTKLGFLVARKLKEEFQRRNFPDMRILLLF